MPNGRDITQLSDEELLTLSRRQPTQFGRFQPTGLKTTAQKVLPTFLTGAIPERGERTLLGSIFERPAAAIRSQLLGRGFRAGALVPEEVPRFQEVALGATGRGIAEQAAKRRGLLAPERPLGRAAVLSESLFKGVLPSVGGLVADIATNPADLLLILAGKVPLGKGRTLGGQVIKTRPAQALGRFGTRERSLVTGRGLPGARFRQAVSKPIGAETARRFRGEFANVKTRAVEQFGSQLDDLARANPNKNVSLREFIDDINFNLNEMSPSARSAIRRTPGLQEMLDNPELANQVSIRKVQDMINFINTKIPKTIKATDIDIVGMASDLRGAQLEAFPEMAGVRTQYRATIEPFNQVKNQFKFNRLLNAVEKDFGGAEGSEAVKALLPPDILKEMGGLRGAQTAIKGAKRIIRRILELAIISGIGGSIIAGAVRRQGGGGFE